MTLTIDHLRINKTVEDILRKFPAIQNNPKYEYHRRGGRGKNILYGLKASDFNKFDFDNGDRIFNYWRDVLVEHRLLLKIFPNKDKGSPYAITPLGIAFILPGLDLARNLLISIGGDDNEWKRTEWDKEVSNCLEVVLHFYKGDTKGLNRKSNYSYFVKSCNMINFEYGIMCRALVGNDEDLDRALDIKWISSTPPKNPIEDKEDLESVANHIVGNMAWAQLHNQKFQIQVKDWATSIGNDKFITESTSKETLTLGKSFGDKVILKTLAEESRRVVEILNS